MSSNGIKDRVAIVGMSCTPFREHFDRSRDDLLIDAADEVLASVGVSKQDIEMCIRDSPQTPDTPRNRSRSVEPLDRRNSSYLDLPLRICQR